MKINFFLKLYIYIVIQLYYVEHSSIILPDFIIFYLTLASSKSILIFSSFKNLIQDIYWKVLSFKMRFVIAFSIVLYTRTWIGLTGGKVGVCHKRQIPSLLSVYKGRSAGKGADEKESLARNGGSIATGAASRKKNDVTE